MKMKTLYKIRRADGLYSLSYYGSNKPSFQKNGAIFTELELNKFIDTIKKLNSGENMFKDCVVEVYENTKEIELDI